MTTLQRLPMHPGELLKEELEAREITQKQFSDKVGVPYTMLNQVLNGKRAVSNDLALIVEAALGINPELLMNMQNRYDMATSRMKPLLNTRLQEIGKMCASWLV